MFGGEIFQRDIFEGSVELVIVELFGLRVFGLFWEVDLEVEEG